MIIISFLFYNSSILYNHFIIAPAMFESYEQQLLGDNYLQGVTPNFIILQLKANPLLNYHYQRNNEDIQYKIIDALMRQPCLQQYPGYVYGFRNKEKYDSNCRQYLIKLGRTGRNPHQRILQWEKDDKRQYIQIFTVRTQFNIKLEFLVHLMFAYARKILYINGKKRIEWFQFQQKVPNAAVVNYLNLIMEEFHAKNDEFKKKKAQNMMETIEKISLNEIHNHDFDNSKLNSYKKTYIIFGYPKSGKTILKQLIQKATANQQNPQQIKTIQISISPQNKKYNLSTYFKIWHILCLSQNIIPIIIINKTDLQSSMMYPIIKLIQIIQQYFILNLTQINIVVNKVDNYNIQKIKAIVGNNQQFIQNKQYLTIIKQAEYICLLNHQISAENQISNQKQQKIKLKQQLKQNLQQQLKQKIIKKTQKNQIKIVLQYNKISQYKQQFNILSRILSQKYKKIIKNKYQTQNNQQNKIQILHKIKNNVEQLIKNNKDEKGHKQKYYLIMKINKQLQTDKQLQAQSLFYIFYQLIIKIPFKFIQIFQEMMDAINAYQVQIIQQYNTILIDIIQILGDSLQNTIKTDNFKVIKMLKQIVRGQNLQNVISIYKQLLKQNFKKKNVIMIDDEDQKNDKINKQIKNKQKQIINLDTDSQNESKEDKIVVQCHNLNQNIENLIKLIQKLDKYSTFGLKFNNILSRVQQNIYFVVQFLQKQKDKQKNKQNQDKAIKQHTQKQDKTIKQIEKIYSQSNTILQQTNIIYKQSQKGIFESKYWKSINKIDDFLQSIEKVDQNQNIINCSQQFIIDTKNTYTIKHSILILAKEIKFYRNFQIKISKNTILTDKNRILVLVAQKWTQMNRLKFQQINPNQCKVLLLLFVDNEMTILRTNLSQNKDGQQIRQLLQNIKKIYLLKIK